MQVRLVAPPRIKPPSLRSFFLFSSAVIEWMLPNPPPEIAYSEISISRTAPSSLGRLPRVSLIDVIACADDGVVTFSSFPAFEKVLPPTAIEANVPDDASFASPFTSESLASILRDFVACLLSDIPPTNASSAACTKTPSLTYWSTAG